MILRTKRARLLSPRNLVFEDVECAEPKEREIRARTLYSAISQGTELAAWEGMTPLRAGPAYPRLVGYCNVAEVLDVGAQVTDVKVGDVVLTHQAHGAHFTCDAGNVLLTVPRPLARAASMLYLAQLGYAALRRAALAPAEVVLVQGLGVIGLSTVKIGALLKNSVIAQGNDASRLSLATRFGATSVVHTGSQVPEGQADVIVSTVNGWSALRDAMVAARPHARIALLGFPGRGQPPPEQNPLDPALFYQKQLSLLAAGFASDRPWGGGDVDAACRANLRLMLGWLAEGVLELDSLITHEVDGLDLAAAYERLALRDKSSLGCVLVWGKK
jgi:threonine dehydrogenase-like Zn-dependent dehydrogenase